VKPIRKSQTAAVQNVAEPSYSRPL